MTAEPLSLSGPAKPVPDADLNQVIERFERAWQSGERPAIDPFIAAVPEADRRASWSSWHTATWKGG